MIDEGLLLIFLMLALQVHVLDANSGSFYLIAIVS